MSRYNIAAETLSYPVMTNCPNCGAIMRGDECEYCGTVFRVQPSKQESSTAESELNKARKEFHNACENFNRLCEQRHLDLIQALKNAKYGI